MLKGIGASQGFGIGKAVVIRDTNLDYSSVKFTDSDHQKKRLHSAVADFSDETKSLVAELKKNAGNKEAEILEGHLVMLEDPFMLAQMEEAIDNGSVAEAAVDSICTMFINMFSGVDDDALLLHLGEHGDERHFHVTENILELFALEFFA